MVTDRDHLVLFCRVHKSNKIFRAKIR
uniref:Uncharacterized protein n=1 Tax=Arundo donax TaxID=35708 RepID=A0A0A9FTZ6_ARUDO